MRGTKPIPTAIKIANGNPGKRPLNMFEPRPEGDLFEPPEWLNDDQRTSWFYAIEHMPAGVLKRIDQSILTIWVVAECLFREATQKVAASGLVVKTERGIPIQNPYLPIINKQAMIMMKASAELGFTPSSRTRIVTDPDYTPAKKGDPLDEFTIN